MKLIRKVYAKQNKNLKNLENEMDSLFVQQYELKLEIKECKMMLEALLADKRSRATQTDTTYFDQNN